MSKARESGVADTIFFGGDIITVDDGKPEAEALASAAGRSWPSEITPTY